MERDLGQMGEDIFRLWCSNVGLAANPSVIDKYGWDFIVEFPAETEKGISFDRMPSPYECKVQVKATDGNQRKLQVKLSALLRLVQYNGPAFICFIEFDGDDTPSTVFLREVDEDIIRRTLMKLRKMDSKGESNFHERTITIKFTEMDAVNPSGKSLKQKIMKVIGGNAEGYLRRKSKYRDTVGYEGPTKKGIFTLESVNGIEDIVDLSIGLKESVSVNDFSMHDMRFGIKSRNPDFSSGVGKITFPLNENGRKDTLTFSWPEKGLEYSFDVTVYSSATFLGGLPGEHMKIRALSPFFDVVLHSFKNAKAEFSFTSLDGEEDVLIADLLKFVQVLELFQSNTEDVVEVGFGAAVGMLKFNSERSPPGSWVDSYAKQLVVCAWEVAKEYYVHNKIVTNMRELIENQEHIINLHNAIVKGSTIDFSAVLVAGSRHVKEKSIVLVTNFAAKFGGMEFVSIVKYEGGLSIDGESVIGKNLACVDKRNFIYEVLDVNMKKEIEKAVEHFSKSNKNESDTMEVVHII